ncbi:MAG: hypothetical protein HN405_05015 [Planctomycetes bacterium]|jgi:hypothetical protein|nr:hypothetical protein [Planctomycetota bacterium]MBT4028989.1 hypothetical protein [Planctomycetota bacterium]MBT4560257.1 hypothetical protein [Planctomycetota bacterium]
MGAIKKKIKRVKIERKKLHSSANAAVRLIRAVEKEFDFKSGVKNIVVRKPKGDETDYGQYHGKSYWFIRNRISVPAYPARSVDLKEYIYHELGHAIHDHFDITDYLSPFINKVITVQKEYVAASKKAVNWNRLPNFVNGYARTCREEDFCETLAAYLCNRATWQKRIKYAGYDFRVKKNSKLMEKLDAVDELLKDLHTFDW